MSTAIFSRGDATELHRHGQQLYQKGDFKAAIHAFTEALSKRNADLLGILDNRAATYTKLLQHDLALRDAKQMIKKDKSDERGYLRSAKILLLDGKPDKALEVYAYGLKTLPEENPRRQLLQKLHDKLCDRFAKCQDPFTVLPLEIADMVLRHFNFKQIVAILRVSKAWDRFLSSLPKLWMRIDLSGARGKIHWSSVRSYIRRSKAMLTHATVANLSLSSTNKIMEFLSRCPKLEYLEVRASMDTRMFYDLFKNSKHLKTLKTSSEMTFPQSRIVWFLNALPLLERIEVHGASFASFRSDSWPRSLPNLKSIILRSQSTPPVTHIPALYVPGLDRSSDLCSIPNLEELCLVWEPQSTVEPYEIALTLGCFPRLRRLDLTGVSVDRAEDIFLPPSLEYLRFSGGRGGLDILSPDKVVELPKLDTLIFHDAPWVSYHTIHRILKYLKPRLRRLHVDTCLRFTTVDLMMLTDEDNHLGHLEELNISFVQDFHDGAVNTIIDHMEKLKILDLSYTKITGCTVKTLADLRASDEDGKIKLDRLNVRGCDGVSSDAVAYGRAKGLEIIT